MGACLGHGVCLRLRLGLNFLLKGCDYGTTETEKIDESIFTCSACCCLHIRFLIKILCCKQIEK